MNLFNNIVFFMKEAAFSFRRGGIMSMTSISTITISLTVLGAFLLLNMNLDEFAVNLRSQVEVIAYLENGHTESEQQEMLEYISRLPGVEKVEYISGDEALARLREDFAGEEFLFATITDNPLPASFEIRMTDPALVKGLAENIQQRYERVYDVSYGEDIVLKIEAMAEMMKMVGATLVILLGLASLFIIANTIKLTVYARRQEIEIMKLVGATNWFIRIPFLIEGLFQGLIGAAIAVTVIYSAYEVMIIKTNEILPIFPFVTDPLELAKMSLKLLLIGGILGITGSMFSVRKFLKL